MSWIDLVIAAVVILGALSGRAAGAFRQVGSAIGLLTGFIIGAWMAPWLVSDWRSNLWRPLAAVGILLCATSLGSSLGRAVGGLGNLSMRRLRLAAVDASVGAGVGGLAGLVSCWLLAGVLVSTPWSYVVGPIQSSKILATLDAVMPPVPSVEAQLGALVRGADFPGVFTEVVAPTFTTAALPTAQYALATAGGAQSAVVLVRAAQACGGDREGTGFYVSPHLLVTNAHVLEGSRHISVSGLSAHVVAFDPQQDLALVRTTTASAHWLAWGSLPTAGTPAAIICHPLGGPEMVTPAGYEGSVQATGRDIYNQGSVTRAVLVLAGLVQPGNSGSPVVVHGRVIGVVFSRLVSGSTTYAIAAKDVATFVAHSSTTSPVSTGVCPV